jgi:hypothetical protein
MRRHVSRSNNTHIIRRPLTSTRAHTGILTLRGVRTSDTFPETPFPVTKETRQAMADIARITFVDVDSGDDGVVLVRTHNESVGVAVSLRRDGDVEVFLGPNEVNELIEALTAARATLI